MTTEQMTFDRLVAACRAGDRDLIMQAKIELIVPLRLAGQADRAFALTEEAWKKSQS